MDASSEFRHNVFAGLLYLASDKGTNHLPSIYEFVTSELVGAVYEDDTGQEFLDIYSKVAGFDSDGWYHRINQYLDTLNDQNKFNPALAEAIRSQTYFTWHSDHGEKWWDNPIRFWFMFGGHNRMQSTFALTVPEAREAERGLGALDLDTRRHIENIAEIMKKYVRADVEFIKQHYSY